MKKYNNVVSLNVITGVVIDFGISNMFMQDILVVVDVHNLWLYVVDIVEHPLKKEMMLKFNNER